MQVKWDALRTLGYTGSINDMYILYMQDRGAASKQINDAEAEWLTIEGYTGANEDKWFTFLRALGYTGTRQDMEYQYWLAGGSVILSPGGLLAEGGEILTDELGNILLQD